MRSPCLLMSLAACSACSDADTATEDNVTQSALSPPVAAATWSVESGTRIEGVTSSCTLRLADGTFRIYFGPSGPATAGPFRSSTSTDGLTWSSPTDAGLVDLPGVTRHNPSVVQVPDGTYVLIFEGDSPGIQRFYRAVSTDGIVFTETAGAEDDGAVMVPSDADAGFISVPDLILLPDGRVRMYYVALGDHIESAVSDDAGLTWEREGSIGLQGITSTYQVDPDVVAIPGGYWLFMAIPPSSTLTNHRIYSALSTDGRSFVAEDGERVTVDDEQQIRYDPDVFAVGDGRYRVNFGQPDANGPDLHSAISPLP